MTKCSLLSDAEGKNANQEQFVEMRRRQEIERNKVVKEVVW